MSNVLAELEDVVHYGSLVVFRTILLTMKNFEIRIQKTEFQNLSGETLRGGRHHTKTEVVVEVVYDVVEAAGAAHAFLIKL